MIAIIGVFVYKKFNDKTAPLISVNTTDGLKKTILPDRSQVVISRYSKLTYVKNFDGASREVNLTGEAFFDVTHDADKPFIIHTAIADVRVVGTSFNVAADSNKTQVSVEKGKVLVYTKDDSVYIEPGQAVTIQAGRESITADTAVDKNSWGYATRKFEFKNASLNEVFRCIEKSYPCSIEVQNNAINNCKLTASFENASAEYIVTLIAETLDLTLTTKNNVFVLQGKGCP
jgi:ferric-dicitrate binding protein FerR (iron transport regulator)